MMSWRYQIPAKSQKPFLQYMFDEQLHPVVVVYLDVNKVMPFDMLSSQQFLQLYQQGELISIHTLAREPRRRVEKKTVRNKSFETLS